VCDSDQFFYVASLFGGLVRLKDQMNQHHAHRPKHWFVAASALALLAVAVTPGCGASGDSSNGTGSAAGQGPGNTAGTGATAHAGGGAGNATAGSGNGTSGAGTSTTAGATGLGGAAVGASGAGTTSGGATSASGGGATSSAGATSAGGAPAGGGATSSGGTTSTAGAGGAVTGGAGAGPVVTQSSSCKIPTWPTATGTPVTITGTKSVTGTYDGKMALHNGTLNDCTTGDQSSTKAMIEIADGGTVKNIVFGPQAGDGIHCLGSCTIDNVWFPYICDDAITMLGGSGKTATITNSGFKNARDKTIQHNGDGSTVVLNNIYVETAGKLYRSCGQGCSTSETRTATISNIVAIGASQIAGVSTNDKVTLSNICTYRTPSICRTYKPGTETETTIGANGTDEGPDANCIYKGSDTHSLVSDVTGGFTTDVTCTGPNSVKTGGTSTACVTSFETCLRGCAPGSFGFRQTTCTNNSYTNGGGCALPSDPTIAAHFASSNATSATATVTSNDPCTTEWAWATDGAGKYCMCVPKPGYYQAGSGWWVWDCQSAWW
jgi:pectate lyase